MQVPESIYTHLVPCLADVLSGFGLSVLLEFSRTSPDLNYLVAVGLVAVLAVGALALTPICQKATPVWLSLCNLTYSLVVTLALSLNLMSQLCPPSGKELSLIPAYCLLCIPRTHPSTAALLWQAGAVTLLIMAFLVVQSPRPVRPSGDVGSRLSLALSMLAGSWLQTFDSNSIDPMAVLANSLNTNHVWWRSGSLVFKGLLLLLLGTVKNSSLYSFMYDRSNSVSGELFIVYGTLLLFSCMQAAALWFEQLKRALGSQAKWRLVVRIRHIIYVLVVAAAWVYPLQLHSLRLMILTALLVLNLIFSF